MNGAASPASWAFWLALAALAWAYAGFPLLLAAWAALRRGAAPRKHPATPRMSLVIAAYNEEENIGERLENALGADYPPESLEVVVASDGSTDGTADVVRRQRGRGVRLLDLPRQGKIPALDAAVRLASGEVLVFSDANTHMEPGALRAIAANFSDPEVGGVVGHTGYRQPGDGDSAGRGEALYWRYDTWLKAMESRTGSVVSAHGGLYAIRRDLYRTPEDPAVTDDFAISTAVVEQGRRLVFEPEARAWEVAVPDAGSEFRRRVRLMTRGLRGVALRRRLLNPFRYGFYSVSLFSHKVLRRLVPVALLLLLASSLALAPAGGVYAAAAAAQVTLYAIGLVGWAARRTPVGRWPLLYAPFYFAMANLAALVALFSFARGRRVALWEPQRHDSSREARPRDSTSAPLEVPEASRPAGEGRRAPAAIVGGRGSTFVFALLAGVAALAVLVRDFDAPVALVGAAGLVGLVALIFKPALAIVLVAFLLYSNLAVVGHRMHGVPEALAGSFVLLLAVPLAHHVLLRGERLRADPVFRLMLLFLAVMLASSLVAADKAIAVERIESYLLQGLLIYWLVVNAVRGTRSLRHALWAVLAAGAFLAGLSLYQAATGANHQQFGGLAQRSARVHLVPADGPDEEAVTEVRLSYRAGGPMGDPNRYAQILIVLVPLGVVFARHGARRSARWCAGGVVALLVGGIVVSYSRAGLLSLALLVAALIALRWIRPGHLLAGAVCVALLSPVLAPRIVERMATLGTTVDLVSERHDIRADGAIRGRATQMLAAAHVAADYPFFGVGPGQYSPVYSAEYHQALPTRFRYLDRSRRAHNLYLEMAAETGLVGLTVFLAVFGVLIKRLVDARARWKTSDPFAADLTAAFALSVAAYLVTSMFLSLAYERYLWFLLALAAAALHVLGRADSWRRERGARPGAARRRDSASRRERAYA